MNMLLKKIISKVMIICLILNFGVGKLTFAKDNNKKAIIIIPGICGSELFSAQEQEVDGEIYSKGHRFWPPECLMPFVDIDEFKKLEKLEGFSLKEIQTNLDLIAYNDEGNSKVSMMSNNPILDCKSNPENRNFGVVDCYKGLVDSVVKSVDENEYDVVFFSYDWRRSNGETAKDLENLIIENNYKNVTLIGHSMGSLICASYLANIQDKSIVDKTLLLGGPMLGAAKAYSTLDEGKFVDGLLGIMTCPLIAPIIRDIVKNCPAVYELLPPKQYFDVEPDGYLSKWSTNEENNFLPVKLKSYKDTVEFINKRGISKVSNKLLTKAQSFYDSLFKDGHYVLEDEDLKIYNIIGINQLTPNNILVNKKLSCGIWTNIEFKSNGDGMVTIQSALAGNALSKKTNYYLRGIEHMALMFNKISLNLICNILKNNFNVSDINKLVVREELSKSII